MDNKELEEKSSPIDSTKQVTSTVKKTKPRDPGRIAAGKKIAEYNKKAREAKTRSSRVSEKANKEIPNESKQETSNEGSFSLTQILSVASIVVSLAGLYYKREELMSLVKPERNKYRAPARKEETTQRETNLECQRESEKNLEEPKKDSKFRQMD